jgi:hypothetical protein
MDWVLSFGAITKSKERTQMIMNEEAVDQVDAQDLISEISDEALETAAYNEVLPSWTSICSGIQCPG